jgi:hypothetical protein
VSGLSLLLSELYNFWGMEQHGQLVLYQHPAYREVVGSDDVDVGVLHVNIKEVRSTADAIRRGAVDAVDR